MFNIAIGSETLFWIHVGLNDVPGRVLAITSARTARASMAPVAKNCGICFVGVLTNIALAARNVSSSIGEPGESGGYVAFTP